jgi:hypothetical protein
VQKPPSARYARTARFWRAYRKLDALDRERVKKALAQFLQDRTIPGLRVRRIQGTDRIWEMRAGRDIGTGWDIHATFELLGGEDGTRTVLLRNVDHHDPTLRNP